uniref:uL4m n=1 Tax=Polytomella magna TaxID=353565 RepID=UPI002240E47A|nr:Chain Ac, uL4m [Polytomella magna]8APN_Ac Chain Ac, uL4m [Polytomella magna]8APO_Ac Chain Ac, uL4m [Polytomella magna]
VASYLARICPNTYVPPPFVATKKGFNGIGGRYDPSSPFPPDTGSSPLTLQYPFEVEYHKDREIPVCNVSDGSQVSTTTLNGKIFSDKVRLDILHTVVRYLRAKWQQGTHKTKDRSEVSGGGRKPRPQKGSGRSRQGSIRSPIWRGGGCTFPKIPRSHAFKLPRNVVRIGIRSALSAKANEGRLFVVDSFVRGVESYDQLKAGLAEVTKDAIGESLLLVDSGECGEDYSGVKLRRLLPKDSPRVEVLSYQDLTVYHMLKYHKLVVSEPAVRLIEQELTRPLRNPARAAFWQEREARIGAAVEDL